MGVAYLGFGVLFYAVSFNNELKTYECEDSSVPHGYITIFNNSYVPPSEGCSRRAFRISEIGNAVTLIPLWLPLIIFKAGAGN